MNNIYYIGTNFTTLYMHRQKELFINLKLKEQYGLAVHPKNPVLVAWLFFLNK